MNIGDIAEMAGVSRAAVSRYLNHGYVSKEKCERIRKVIEETGYKPSVMAQTLRTKKTKLVGVILPRIHSDSVSGVVAGIGRTLHEAGYDMLLASSENNPGKEIDFLRVFSVGRVDGVVLIATVFTKEHKQILKDYPVPVVIAGQKLSGVSSVYHDDFGAGAAVARHLLDLGRKRIGYIGVLKEDLAVGRNRFAGFEHALKEAGILSPRDAYVTADFSVQSGYDRMEKLLRRYPETDAVICATDSIALGAMYCLKAHGKNIPEEIALAGFGDNLIAAVTTPPITTIHFHYQMSGRIAAEMVLKQMSGTESAPEEEMLGFTLLERGSTVSGMKTGAEGIPEIVCQQPQWCS